MSPDTVVIEPGPAVDLGPRTIMSLSLILHELATNAAKFGALSVAGGKVTVGWTVEDDNARLRLTWVESGGPPVSPPETTGYGSKLIQSIATYSLGGQVEQVFAEQGLEAGIVVPLGTAPSPG